MVEDDEGDDELFLDDVVAPFVSKLEGEKLRMVKVLCHEGDPEKNPGRCTTPE